jgi:lipoate-protein ligase A
MKAMRLIIDSPADGTQNMLIDQVLFDLHKQGVSSPAVRFYNWRETAVSLGVNQVNCGLISKKCERSGIKVVRRPTGGRAIIHEPDDFTFSVVASSEVGFPCGLTESYAFIANGIIAGLKKLDLDAKICDGKHNQKNKLCFSSSAIADIAVSDKKICGCAQYREGQYFLQQGMIPGKKNPQLVKELFGLDEDDPEFIYYKNETIAMDELFDHVPSYKRITEAMIDSFEEAWQIKIVNDGYSKEEKTAIGEMLKNITLP